ncbi:MAG: response regulator transcription factor [Rhodospirillaceae bacterium]|jgi:DNA-binding response OmpR family regulator
MSTENKILLCERDPLLANAIAEQLQCQEGLTVFPVSTEDEARDIINRGRIDLCILGEDLPDRGASRLQKLSRQVHDNVPVIVMGLPRSEVEEGVDAEVKGDEYIFKPVKIRFLIRKICELLLKVPDVGEETLEVGPFDLSIASLTLIDRATGDVLRMTEKEIDILKYLLGAGDDVVSRDVLLREVWGYNSGVTTHTVETHVYRLRQKLEADPSRAQILITGPGGYRLSI